MGQPAAGNHGDFPLVEGTGQDRREVTLQTVDWTVYLDKRKARDLYIVAAALSFGYTTKETTFISYAMEKKLSRTPEKFGTGMIEE
jgi:hypothetical protein